MGVKRYELNEAQWGRIAPLFPVKASDPGRTGSDNRLFVNGVLWVLRSGAHWQDLPERFATRFDRLANQCLAFIHIAAAIIWMG